MFQQRASNAAPNRPARAVRSTFDFGPFEHGGGAPSDNPIDQAVAEQLRQARIAPARLCSDAVFLRRAHLDVIGTIPTVEEAKAFLDDKASDKRAKLIDALLVRDEFADYWTMRWSDLLRVKAEFPINLWPNAVQAYYRWIHTAIKENMPYDRFVRELLTSSGSNFRTPQVNFFRAVQSSEPEEIAKAVALTFMGSRTDHWTDERVQGMAAFFSRIGYKTTAEWKEEIVLFDPALAAEAPAKGIFPDGKEVEFDSGVDPRMVFADWLISPTNPWFTGCVANRVWCWLQGRGIVHEPDDIRASNPPSNPALLKVLCDALLAADYDLKSLMRLILTSTTYQLSSIPRSDDPKALSLFAYYPLRRLDAEVLIDALCQITGTNEEYSSPIPEPFTFIPEDQRSIALADGSITSSFLELFGRPPRDTGMYSERNNQPSPQQRLHMLNSSHIQQKIANSMKHQGFMQKAKTPADQARTIYLLILSRYPTAEELQTIGEHIKANKMSGWDAVIDLVWALINSPEFMYRH